MAAILIWLAAGIVPLHAQLKTQKFQGKLVAAGEALVKFRPGAAPGPQLRVKENLALIQSIGGTGTYLLRSKSKSAAALVGSLRQRSDVLYAEPNYVLEIQTIPNDELFGEQWPLWNTGQTVLGLTGTPGADIGTSNAWELSSGNRDHVVAVLDTGVDQSHPDLVNNLWSAPGSFAVTLGGRTLECAAGTHGFNIIKRTCDPSDDNQHGTQMAGIIGAEGNNVIGISGVNWIASMMPVKFLDARGTGTTSNAIDAVEFAVQAKA
ncbi:MAG: S8 family serine peptidase, partial [Longimicrobiales bacterium]